MTDDRLTRLQAMAQRFSTNGSVDQITMRKINALALSSQPEDMPAEKIKQLRQRENISQAVLATILNMSSESVQKWEQGKTRPQGAALRLLNIIDQKGLDAVVL